jgi:Ser/Thr protein kinase RdoA (MazF antagonist)
MGSNQKLEHLLRFVETSYDLSVSTVSPFGRRPEDSVINLVLECSDGRKFFLKQIQAHSLRPELETIYEGLSSIRTEGYRLVLPVQNQEGRFVTGLEGQHFQLLRFESIRPFSAEQVPISRMISILEDFHGKVRNFSVPGQSFRTFGSWLQRGPDQFRHRFGEGLPFVPLLEEYLATRFRRLKFEEGVIHWDIHRENLGLDPEGGLLLLDFDLVQLGPYALDFMRLAQLYRKPGQDRIEIPSEVLEALFEHVRAAPDLEMQDLRFWIGRSLMMEAWDRPEVRGFMQAIEDWVVSGTRGKP